MPKQDYFYVCPGHLKDKSFCSPIVDEAEAAAKRKKEEMDREIELIKKEYDDKMKKKKEKKEKDRKDKEDQGKEKEKEEKTKVDEEYDKAEKEKEAKVKPVCSAIGTLPITHISRSKQSRTQNQNQIPMTYHESMHCRSMLTIRLHSSKHTLETYLARLVV